ncbi:MAG: leucine-rich repeat protein [Oscillospiraceae bacterium]|nr:leucine-rich repeat protein [Oscillospiraceae bacterium]
MKKHKRFYIWALSILLAGVPITSMITHDPETVMIVSAEDSAIPFEYQNCGDHIEITRYTSTKYVMEIPTEIEGLPVTKIAPGAFKGDPDIAYAYFPDTLEEVGEHAFEGCWQLTTLDFQSPEGVKKIGSYAFYNCQNLEAIVLPDSVEEIGAGAFANSGIRHAVLPASLRELSQEVFAGDTQLDTVMFPANIERIEEDAFKNCDALHTVCYKGSEDVWKVQSVGSGNEPLRNAKFVYNYNQRMIERPYTFDPERDSWAFTNNEVGYYVMSDETFAELTAQMSNLEQEAAMNYWEQIKQQYAGCCAGMADLALLAAAGILDPATLDPEATCLHDVKLTDEVRELLTYYLIMENSGTLYDNDVYQASEIYDCLANGIPLLFCYYMLYPTGNEESPYTIAGHAVIAYGMEEGLYTFDDTVYRKKILTYDSNLPEERMEEGYIYADPEVEAQRVPIYVPYWAAKGARDMNAQSIRRSLDMINLHGIHNEISTITDREADRMGDVNEDGVVNASDAALVLIASAIIGAGDASGLTESQKKAADVNADGSINASDAACILQFAAVRGSGTDMTMKEFMVKYRTQRD